LTGIGRYITDKRSSTIVATLKHKMERKKYEKLNFVGKCVLSIILRGGDSCLTVRVQEEHCYYKTQKEKKTQFTTCHVKVGGEVKAQSEVVLRDKLVF